MIRARADQLLSERDNQPNSEGVNDARTAPRRSHSSSFDQRRRSRNVANGDRDGFLLAYEDHEPLTAGDAGVEEISLQHVRTGMITAGYSEPWLLWIVA